MNCVNGELRNWAKGAMIEGSLITLHHGARIMIFKSLIFIALGSLPLSSAVAQLGTGWEEFTPRRDLHLGDKGQPKYSITLTYKEDVKETYGTPNTASYQYSKETGVETFALQAPGERAEVRVRNDYSTGSQQFEGWVTIQPPIERQMIFQIWGSGIPERATQMYLRAYNQDNGLLKVYMSGQPVKSIANHVYNREIQVNVIHLQEDVGAKILVFLNRKKVLEEDDNFPKIINNEAGNYHKYGCYGSFELEFTTAKTSWRHVRHFRGGKAPEE
jgi:hypothetical protein